MHEIIFGGKSSKSFPWLMVRRIIRPLTSEINPNLLSIDGRDGAYSFDSQYDPLYIQAVINIKGADGVDLETKAKEISAWLRTKGEQEIIFSTEPDTVYYGKLAGSSDLERIVNHKDGTITFVIPDGIGYGLTRSQLIHDPDNDPEMNPVIENNGNQETYPRFRIQVVEPITFLTLAPNDESDNYMMLGFPPDLDLEPVERRERIMDNPMNTLTGWTAGDGVDGGTIAGQFSVVSRGWTVALGDFGSGDGWHGPALKTSLSESLQDFRVEADAGLLDEGGTRVGRTEIYLLDEANQFVARMGVRDFKWGQHLTQGYIQVYDGSGGHRFLIYEYGNNPGVWNDFDGVLRLEREGNRFYAYIAKVRDGEHYARRSVYWTDDLERFTGRRVAQIQVHMANFHDSLPHYPFVSRIQAWKVNDPDANQVPIIANPGDQIEIDHATNKILLNGEDFKYTKDFGARFWALQRGLTEVVANPRDSIIVNADWNERW